MQQNLVRNYPRACTREGENTGAQVACSLFSPRPRAGMTHSLEGLLPLELMPSGGARTATVLYMSNLQRGAQAEPPIN